MSELTEEEMARRGAELAKVLDVKKDWIDPATGKYYSPCRYKTTWGNKTDVGLYQTVKRIIEGDF